MVSGVAIIMLAQTQTNVSGSTVMLLCSMKKTALSMVVAVKFTSLLPKVPEGKQGHSKTWLSQLIYVWLSSKSSLNKSKKFSTTPKKHGKLRRLRMEMKHFESEC